ncbi:iron complex outermembrane receptor protein [Altererythrobacter atlanticus]|nr:TonB-dependent receptor [Croceibacterium atlanticum]MBB5733286.1 iron complex outermembrane receptor protein [Croceibacterium atlanticum]
MPGLISAQEVTADAGEPIAEESAGPARIIVTAERRATDLQDTPLSIVAVTQETIESKGIEDLDDLATFTPNLNITGGRGSGGSNPQFSIRGVSGGGGATGERGVGLYLDGIYIPRTNGSVLRVLDIDRVEVLRGPQGTLFGRNSTGGAIRYFTKRPEPGVTEGYVRATIANMDRHDLVGALNVPVGDDAALRVQGAYLNQGGWVTRGTQELGKTTDYIGRADLRFEPTSDLTVDLGFLYSDSRSNGTPHVFEEFDMRPGLEGFWEGNYGDWLNDALKLDGQAPIAAYNDPRIVIDDFTAPGFCLIDDFDPDFDEQCEQFDNTEYWQASLNLAYDLSDNVSVSSISGISRLDNNSNLDWQYLGTERRLNEITSEVFYQELQLNASLFAGAVDLVVGGSYFHEKSFNDQEVVNRRGTSDTPRGGPNANIPQPNGNADLGLFHRSDTETTQTSDSYGLFASATWHITPDLNFTGGLRYAHDYKSYESTEFAHETFTPAPGTDRTTVNSDHNWDQVDWRASVDYHLTDTWMWYVTASKAYKAGSYGGLEIVDNIRGEDQSGEFLLPIAPEKVVNFETGMRIEAFDRRLRFNPTAFYMLWTNRQAARQAQCSGQVGCPEPPGFQIEIQNTGDVDIYGVELEAQVFLTNDFWLDGSAGYTGYDLKDPVANSGPNLFPGPPEFSFNVGATYIADLGFGELTFNANYAYTSDQPTHPTETGDSAYRLPAIDLVNARIRFEPDNAPVSISLFANNLLDNTYASYATRFGGGYWDRGGPLAIQIPESRPERTALFVVRGKPREVGLTLQYDF